VNKRAIFPSPWLNGSQARRVSATTVIGGDHEKSAPTREGRLWDDFFHALSKKTNRGGKSHTQKKPRFKEKTRKIMR